VLSTLVAPVLRQWNDRQLEEAAQKALHEVLKDEHPFLYEAIVESPTGEKWFVTLVTDLVKFLKRQTIA